MGGIGGAGDETIAMSSRRRNPCTPVTPGSGGLNTMQPTQAQQRSHIATDPEPEKKSKRVLLLQQLLLLSPLLPLPLVFLHSTIKKTWKPFLMFLTLL